MWDLLTIKKMNTDAEIRKQATRARLLNWIRELRSVWIKRDMK